MCDSGMIREYGLVGTFDTIAMMSGERVAIIMKRDPKNSFFYTNPMDTDDTVEDTHCATELLTEATEDTRVEIADDGGVTDGIHCAAGYRSNDEEDNNDGTEDNDGDPEEGDDNDDDDDDDEEEEEEEEGGYEEEEETQGISYTELQYFSQSLSKQLYYRFGVRTGDRVLLICLNNTGAEVTAMLACARLGATFIPIDESWLSVGSDRLSVIIEDASPVAAIVVGENDQSPTIKVLNSFGIYRCSLVTTEGVLVEEDASVSSSAAAGLWEGGNDSLGDFVEYNPTTGAKCGPAGNVVESTTDRVVISIEEEPVPLYILYTSGSTGKPKGVLGTYKGLLNRIAWQMDTYPWEFGEVTCRRTPLTFVDAMAEIFGSLLCFIPLWLPDPEIMRSGGINAIAKAANDANVTRITLLPSQLHMALKLNENLGSDWPNLKFVYISGEECQWMVVTQFKKILPNATLINLYGSTEVAGDVTFCELASPDGVVFRPSGAVGADTNTDNNADNTDKTDKHSSLSEQYPNCVPIGQPITNNYLFIIKLKDSCPDRLSTDNSTVAESPNSSTSTNASADISFCGDDEIGELMVVGEHVSAGYYNRPLENAQKFLDNPLLSYDAKSVSELREGLGISEEEWSKACGYKTAFMTGDLVYRDSATQRFIWISRVDRQVKIRGVRLELEEVERTASRLLNTADGIAVIAVKERDLEESDVYSNKLVLFVEQSVLDAFRTATKQTTDDGAPLTTAAGSASDFDLFAHLRTHLLPIMVPSQVIALSSQLPRTVSNKIDRQQLLRDYTARQQQPPHSSISKRANETLEGTLTVENIASIIHTIFCEVVPSFDYNSQSNDFSDLNFITMGGDSMTGIEVIYKLKLILQQLTVIDNAEREQTVNRDITVTYADLLNNTIEQLAEYFLLQMTGSTCTQVQENNVGTERAAKRARVESTTALDTDIVTEPVSIVALEVTTVCHQVIDRESVQSVEVLSRASKSATHICHSSTAGIAAPPMDRIASSTDGLLSIVWKAPLAKCVDSSPLIVIRTHSATTTICDINDVSGGRITTKTLYIGSHGGDVTAVDANTGSILWQTQTHQHIEAAAVTNSTADVIFVASYAGTDVDGFAGQRTIVQDSQCLGTIWALDAYNGTVLWKEHTKGEIKGSPAVYHHGSGDDSTTVLLVGDYSGTLYAFDACTHSSGADISTATSAKDSAGAQTDRLLASLQLRGSIYASPVLSKINDSGCCNHVYVATTSGNLYCVGYSVCWDSVQHPSQKQNQALSVSMQILGVYSTEGPPIFSTPLLSAVGDDNNNTCKDNNTSECVLFGVVDGSIRCVAFHDKISSKAVAAEEEGSTAFETAVDEGGDLSLQAVELWSVHTSGGAVFSTPCPYVVAGDADTVCGGSQSAPPLSAVSGSTAADVDANDSSSAGTVANHAVTATGNGSDITSKTRINAAESFLIGSHDGKLKHIHIATGTVLWETNIQTVIFSAPYCTADGRHCVISTAAGEIIARGMADSTVVKRMKLPGEVYSSPVVLGNQIFVGCRDDQVYCIEF